MPTQSVKTPPTAGQAALRQGPTGVTTAKQQLSAVAPDKDTLDQTPRGGVAIANAGRSSAALKAMLIGQSAEQVTRKRRSLLHPFGGGKAKPPTNVERVARLDQQANTLNHQAGLFADEAKRHLEQAKACHARKDAAGTRTYLKLYMQSNKSAELYAALRDRKLEIRQALHDLDIQQQARVEDEHLCELISSMPDHIEETDAFVSETLKQATQNVKLPNVSAVNDDAIEAMMAQFTAAAKEEAKTKAELTQAHRDQANKMVDLPPALLEALEEPEILTNS